MGNRLIIASRSSNLALKQTDEAIEAIVPCFLPDIKIEIVHGPTMGDKDLETPLTHPSIPDDFFTREIDRLILDQTADIAVHSAKDLPETLHPDLLIAALLPAKDIRDALILRSDIDVPETIGTSSPKREQEIKRLFPDATTKSIRGSIEQRLDQLDHGKYDAIIVAACALQRLNLEHRISHYLDYETTPQQGRLALVVHKKRNDLFEALRSIDVREKAGLAVMLGCPADADLLPPKSLRYLNMADIVLYDRLIPETIKKSISHKGIHVGKKGHKKSVSQNEIHRMILHETEQGKLVVRLHGGDPTILGHLGETLDFLESWNLRADVVTAPSAPQIAASKARASLTHRHKGRSLTLLSGHDPERYQKHFPGPEEGNLAVYMAACQRNTLHQELERAGWHKDTPVIIGEQLGWDTERTREIPLSELPDTTIDRPAVILIGPTAHRDIGYTLFTGTDPMPFLKHGPLIHRPFIQLKNIALEQRVARLKTWLPNIKGIIFPSRYAVNAFMEALFQMGDVRLLASHTLLAVGPSTGKELQEWGIRPDITPPSFEGLHALSEAITATHHGNYLYPCSDVSPTQKRISHAQEVGITLLPEPFYTNEEIHYDALPRQPYSRVLFTSSSTVNAYFTNFPEEKKAQRQWVALGTSTLKTLKNLGLNARMLPS